MPGKANYLADARVENVDAEHILTTDVERRGRIIDVELRTQLQNSPCSTVQSSKNWFAPI